MDIIGFKNVNVLHIYLSRNAKYTNSKNINIASICTPAMAFQSVARYQFVINSFQNPTYNTNFFYGKN